MTMRHISVTRSTALGLCLVLATACGDDERGGDDEGGGIGPGDGTGSGSGADDGGDAGDDRFDLGDDGETGGGGGDCPGGGGDGDVEFSFIWIANSPEGTVSKINTRTLIEEGRYLTSGNPSLQANQGPSRTSVNLDGDVAVADRDGGIVKIYATPERCPGFDQPGFQTSDGPTNVLPWGQDDCVAWRIELPQATRPAAWTVGEQIDECHREPPKLWTSSPNPDGLGGATVWLLHGADGSEAASIEIAAADCQCATFGLYGGAVDADNNLWVFPRDGSPHGTGPLMRIAADASSYDVIPKPDELRAYGIAVDRDGRPWVAGDADSLAFYDPASGQWTVIDPQLPATGYVLRGLMQDADGQFWIAALNGWDGTVAGPPGILQVDGITGTVVGLVDTAVLPGLIKPAGTSIDVDDGVWLVDTDGQQAFRYDPTTGTAQVVGGLNLPYTYSDMTGFGLKNVAMPPQG